jgi:hypothetical protein
MEACGDKGQQTELEAREHQGGGGKKKANSKPGGNKQGNKKAKSG